MIDRIVSRNNMLKAYERVVGNNGSSGIDGMQVGELKSYLQEHWHIIKQSIQDGTYRPKPVKGIEIDKPKGGKRLLGIPTVLDRMIQQSIQQVLETQFDSHFSKFSYGFRKGKNALQAVKQAQQYANSGSRYVVDIDLSKFFDRVNHDYLMNLISKTVHDKLLLSLIRRYLQSGIMIGGLTMKRTEGTPQGSPLSPLLSNILLNELDKELEKRNHRFVRYADDFSIYVRTKRAAQRVMKSITYFVKTKLKLKINKEKSAVRYVGHMELLGYGIYRMRNQQFGLKVQEENWKKFVRKCKAITKKSRPLSFEERVSELKSLCYGWIGYFRYANIKTRLTGLDRLIGSRLRYCIWKSWKRIRTRIRNLKKLGLPEWLAVKWGFTRRGGWHVVQSPILQTTITNERLQKKGFMPTAIIYERFSHV
ncbi:group II intron reverse transcriptase/maturase [Marinifilum fragile]|uniref:group II intron reverse transcriptase/maturase n=1 Tax=Marinifilum fragile TaxID=570161 RepID=UPI002AA60E33|nr:group II intron reverse transcriptase/maturase [Marinifilum fragile]